MVVSLTQFIDVVASVGLAKYGKAQAVREQLESEYSPGKDFYKGLRDGIVACHRHDCDLSRLDMVLFKTRDPKKRPIYTQRVSSYKEWLGRSAYEWVEPQSAVLSRHGIESPRVL